MLQRITQIAFYNSVKVADFGNSWTPQLCGLMLYLIGSVSGEPKILNYLGHF